MQQEIDFRPIMIRGNKIRIYPTAEQQKQLAVQFGCCRWVYNDALQHRQQVYKETGKGVSKSQLSARLPGLKQEFPWLKDVDAQALQQAIRHLDRAYVNFFGKRARFPKKKKKYSHQSCSFPQRSRLEGNQLRVPKVGMVRAVAHRKIVGKIKTVTISKTATGKYYASIRTDDGQKLPKKPTHVVKVVGADLGLTHYCITDDGTKIENPRFLKKAQNNLRRKQKKLSRTKKGSRNRSKARLLVAKAHECVANARADFQHKLSFRLVDENQAVGLETLKVKNMLKNQRLAKAISDAAWGGFIEKIHYKAEWTGKHFVQIDQWFPSSKTCSCCGHKLSTLPLGIRVWTCPGCGAVHARDVNAARNIRQQAILKLKAEGCTVSACGGLDKSVVVTAPADEAGSPFL